MALTPEDVVNKRFQPTKFREGYDQDEVDDFLDEVVVELRRLNQENEELRQRLIASDSRVNDLSRSGGQAPHDSEEEDEIVVPAPVNAVQPAPPVPVLVATPAVDPNEDESVTTTNLLTLARRLHEEHVREGADKRDSLIAEGQASAERIVAEAEAQGRAQKASLEEERSLLEERIDELRIFEREYRQKLKGYIESQLRELDAPQGALAGSDASGSASFSGFAGN